MLDPVDLYLESLTPESRYTMKQAVNLAKIQWPMQYSDVLMIQDSLHDYSPATINKVMAAVKGVFRKALEIGRIDLREYHQVCDVRRLPVETRERVKPEDLSLIVKACRFDKTSAGVRDLAILRVLQEFRRSEVVALDLEDYENKILVVGRWSIHFSHPDLDRWVERRGREKGPLFCRIGKSGKACLKRISPQAILLVVRKRCDRAGVKQYGADSFRNPRSLHNRLSVRQVI